MYVDIFRLIKLGWKPLSSKRLIIKSIALSLHGTAWFDYMWCVVSCFFPPTGFRETAFSMAAPVFSEIADWTQLMGQNFKWNSAYLNKTGLIIVNNMIYKIRCLAFQSSCPCDLWYI